jgi:hypothetical protein
MVVVMILFFILDIIKYSSFPPPKLHRHPTIIIYTPRGLPKYSKCKWDKMTPQPSPYPGFAFKIAM